MNKGKKEDGASLPGASRFPSLTSSRKRKETEPGKQSRDLTRNPKLSGKTSSGLQSVPEDTLADAPAAKTRLPPLRTQEAAGASKSQHGKKEAKLKVPRPPSCKSSSMVRLISNKDSSVQPDSKLEFRPKTGLKLDQTEQRQPFPPLCPPARPPGQPSARGKRRRLVAASDSEKAPLTPVLPHIEAPAVSRTATLDSQMDVSCAVPTTRIVLQKQTKVAQETLPSFPTSLVGKRRPSYLLIRPPIDNAASADRTQKSAHPSKLSNPVSNLVVAPPTSAKPQKRTSQKVRRLQVRADQASEASQDDGAAKKSCLFPPISRHPPDGDSKTQAPLRPQAPLTRPPQAPLTRASQAPLTRASQAPLTRPPQAPLRPQASEEQPALLPKRRAMDMVEKTSSPERMLDLVAEQYSFSQCLMSCPSTPPEHVWMHSHNTQEERVFLPDFGQMFEEEDIEMTSGNKRETLRGDGSQ